MEEFLKNILGKLGEIATSTGLRLISAFIILVIGFKACKWLVKIIKKSHGFAKLDAGVQTFLVSLLNILLKVLVVISVISILGIPMTNFVAFIASVGVAIGAALQGSLANLAGGIMILIFKPFVIDNYIETAQGSGTVKEITILYTILDTPDNKRIVIPNGAIANEAITNYSFHDTRRLDIPVSVSYSSDIEKVKEILLNQANAHALVLKDPEPFCRLTNHGESSLDFALRVWVKSSDYWTVNFDLKESVKEELDKNGIEIPFPQLDVHLDK
ncbi:MAG: mechanosensitive ion channel family protein [Clostridia bacterium]|nr:mechanosensitive ion channel family protein [Clostridia bacterium]